MVAPASSKEFLDIQATIECGFTLERVRDMIRTYSLFSIIKTRALECVPVINRKCMPRPKILNVNEGVGEALFYPYNVLVNKCSGSCDTLNNPMAKMCAPNIIKRINMKVYNFLMRLNETRNVLWHESCKFVSMQ